MDIVIEAVIILASLGMMLKVGTILFQAFRQERANRAAPVEQRDARIIAKRSRRHGGGGNTSVSTSCYITVEYPDGQREEFPVPSKDYGLLIEGDRGTLSRQGTRFKGFERKVGVEVR